MNESSPASGPQLDPAGAAAMPASVLDAQVDALLARIAADRDRRCAEMQAAAETQARELERTARREALLNVREAVKRERKHAEQALRQAHASSALEVNRAAQRAMQALLAAMWKAIANALERRWNEPMLRKSWLESAIGDAHALLTELAWRIEHGAGWREDDRALLVQLAATGEQRGPPRALEFACDPSVRAGIRVRTTGAVLDATAAGLLAERAQIESDFLAQYLALARAERSSGPA